MLSEQEPSKRILVEECDNLLQALFEDNGPGGLSAIVALERGQKAAQSLQAMMENKYQGCPKHPDLSYADLGDALWAALEQYLGEERRLRRKVLRILQGANDASEENISQDEIQEVMKFIDDGLIQALSATYGWDMDEDECQEMADTMMELEDQQENADAVRIYGPHGYKAHREELK